MKCPFCHLKKPKRSFPDDSGYCVKCLQHFRSRQKDEEREYRKFIKEEMRLGNC